jgi:hypothetical protein
VVSPIVGGALIKGPADKLMLGLGLDTSSNAFSISGGIEALNLITLLYKVITCSIKHLKHELVHEYYPFRNMSYDLSDNVRQV